MRLVIVKRGPDAQAQVVGTFTWQDGEILTTQTAAVGAKALMRSIRPELADSSERAARASMERLARRYSGDYLWGRYEG